MIVFTAVVTFILGLLIGSFLNVCIYRIPEGMSIVTPRSHCPICKHTLNAIDLLPVLSWIFSLGKCRYCGDRFSIRYMMIELLTGVLFVIGYLWFDLTWMMLAYMVLSSILVVITFIDIDHGIIPNELVIFGIIVALPFIGFGIVPAYRAGFWQNALDALLGLLAGAAPLILIDYIAQWVLKRDGMGGGDIKLMAMVGLFLGWKLTLLALLVAVYVGGLVGVIILIRKRRSAGNEADEDEDEEEQIGTTMPFGPFLALGSLVSFMVGSHILTWYMHMFM